MRVIVNEADLKQLQSCMEEQKPLAPASASGNWTPSSAIACVAVLMNSLMFEIMSRKGCIQDNSEHGEAAAQVARHELQAAIGYVTTMIADVILDRFGTTYGASQFHFDAYIDGDDYVAIEHVIKGEVKRFLYDRNR